DKIDRSKKDWTQTHRITLTRYNAGGGFAPMNENAQFVELGKVEIGPGSANKDWRGPTVSGLALVGDKLYMGHRLDKVIWVIDAATGKKLNEIPLESPGELAAAGTDILAVSGTSIVRIQPQSGGKTVLVPEGQMRPDGITAGPDGRIYVSDRQTSTVKVLDPTGKQVNELGKPGGEYAGKWDAQRMVHPQGLVVAPNGWLWVTENRHTP